MQEILQTPAAKRTSLRLFCNTPQKYPSTSGTISNKCIFNQGTGIPSQRGACQEVPCDHGMQRFCLVQVPLNEMQQQNPHMRVLGSANEIFLQGRVEQVLLGFQTLRDMTVFLGLHICLGRCCGYSCKVALALRVAEALLLGHSREMFAVAGVPSGSDGCVEAFAAAEADQA
jgi:hypothetical protein